MIGSLSAVLRTVVLSMIGSLSAVLRQYTISGRSRSITVGGASIYPIVCEDIGGCDIVIN
jgi:hypothetical protein